MSGESGLWPSLAWYASKVPCGSSWTCYRVTISRFAPKDGHSGRSEVQSILSEDLKDPGLCQNARSTSTAPRRAACKGASSNTLIFFSKELTTWERTWSSTKGGWQDCICSSCAIIIRCTIVYPFSIEKSVWFSMVHQAVSHLVQLKFTTKNIKTTCQFAWQQTR